MWALPLKTLVFSWKRCCTGFVLVFHGVIYRRALVTGIVCSVYVRFDRWSKKGVWQRVFEQLSKEPNNEYAMIDSTIVRAHRSAAGARKKGAIPPRTQTTRATSTQRTSRKSDSAWVEAKEA
jgi:transposase